MEQEMTRAPRVAHLASIDLTHRKMLLAQLCRLRAEGFDVAAISAPGPSVPEIEAHGIQHIPWTNITRSWDPAADVRAFRELIGILRRERFDLVHTHNAKPGVMGRMAARLTGVPCIVNTVHGFDAPPDAKLSKRAVYMGLEWLGARFSDLELYQSSRDLQRARRIRMKSRARSVHLGNGTDLTRFDPTRVSAAQRARTRKELAVAEDTIVVGTVGRIVRDKGYVELFEAAEMVADRMPNVAFVAVGEPDTDKDDAIGTAELEHASRFFRFTGWREDVEAVLSIMDVFVLPSWREGFPRSAIEAAAMGTAMVLSDIPGCREVASPEVEALFVPLRDATALADAITRLVRDQGLRTRLGSAARRRAIECFDEGRVAEEVARQSRRLLEAEGLLPRGAAREAA
jgi:glycosyltransferase involved in cell wall biosynthesis